jgi:hypothetical protein
MCIETAWVRGLLGKPHAGITSAYGSIKSVTVCESPTEVTVLTRTSETHTIISVF